MTDNLRQVKAIVQPAAEDARDARSHRLMAALGVLAVLFFTAAVVLFWSRANALQTQVDDLSDRAQVAQAGWETVASQVRKLGATPSAIPPGPAGAQGPVGPAGAAGRGIASTSISGGDLWITYTDGSSLNAGQVVGKDGATGAPGRGITGANATSGHLVLSYSDGTTSDVGQVVGPQGAAGTPGRGIKSVSTTGSELIVTYDDGTSADAGSLPPGPPGPQGPQGQPGADGKPPAGWTWTDVLGRRYTCARDPNSPDSAPTYTCTAASPVSTSASGPARKSSH